MPKRPFALAATARAVAALTAFSALAQAQPDDAADRIEEVVVTATLRDASASEVPSSVTVLDAAAIADRAATHLDDLLAAVANLNYAKGASRARFLQLRGVGERGQFEEPLNPSVGVVVDGVDLSGIGTVVGMFDVEQVEVLRGPQGTLYGANALAGLVNVVTRAPTDSAEGYMALDVGNYGGHGAGVAVSGPLSDRARGRLAARVDRSDGFIANDHLGRKDTDNIDETTVRARLAVDLSPVAELHLAAGLLDADNGYDAFSLDNTRTTLADQPGHDRQRTTYGTARLVWQDADRLTVEGQLGVAHSDIAYGYDVDWTYDGFHPAGYSYTDDYLRDRTTRTGEVRLRSGPSGRIAGGTTAWTAGWYFLDQDVDLTRQYTGLDVDFTSAYGIDRQALYGQTETRFGARTTLTVGVRLERHSATYRDSNRVAFEPEDNMIGGRVALRREVADNASVYVALARGYKAGGFNADGTLAADLREYGPEVLWNGEAGVSGTFLDGALAMRLALFTMRRDDVQIESSTSRRNLDDSTEFIQYIGNAAKGANSGAELELTYHADNLVLFANVGVLRTEYRDYVTGDGERFDGREQAHAPGYQLNVGGEFTFPASAGEFFARAEAEARDAFYFSDNHGFQSDAYQLLDASAGYRGDGWSVRLWGKNLMDEEYFVRGFFFGNDPRDGYTSRGFTQLGAPRRFGVSATKNW